MATRYLTELFSLMRNSHSYRNSHFSSRGGGDSEKLLKRKSSGSDEEVELNDEYVSPPIWSDTVENTKYTISKISTKQQELEVLHKKQLRPDFVEKSDDEIMMEQLSQEISKLIGIAHKNIMIIRSHQFSTNSPLEKRLIECVIRGLTVTLQSQTGNFRNEQNSYLKQINQMEEYTNEFFDSLSNFNNNNNNANNNDDIGLNKTSVDSFDNFLKPTTSTTLNFNQSQLDDLDNDDRLDEYFQIKPSQKFNQQQLLRLEADNTKMVEAREKEVMNIVKSIVDLNTVYKDLSHLVEEQGTVLDRIDYNIESTQTRVYEGYKQLQKAERYQRANRKMYCIFVLSIVVLFMFILLIIVKF